MMAIISSLTPNVEPDVCMPLFRQHEDRAAMRMWPKKPGEKIKAQRCMDHSQFELAEMEE
jgi:hypothetical protein